MGYFFNNLKDVPPALKSTQDFLNTKEHKSLVKALKRKGFDFDKLGLYSEVDYYAVAQLDLFLNFLRQLDHAKKVFSKKFGFKDNVIFLGNVLSLRREALLFRSVIPAYGRIVFVDIDNVNIRFFSKALYNSSLAVEDFPARSSDSPLGEFVAGKIVELTDELNDRVYRNVEFRERIKSNFDPEKFYEEVDFAFEYKTLAEDMEDGVFVTSFEESQFSIGLLSSFLHTFENSGQFFNLDVENFRYAYPLFVQRENLAFIPDPGYRFFENLKPLSSCNLEDLNVFYRDDPNCDLRALMKVVVSL